MANKIYISGNKWVFSDSEYPAGVDLDSLVKGESSAHAARHEEGGDDQVTPAVHASRHESGGADDIKLDDLAAPDDTTDLDVSTTKHGLCPKLPDDALLFLDGTGNYSDPSASGITILDRTVTQLDVANTAAETTFYTYDIAADLLSTNKAIRLSLIGDYLNNSGAAKALQVKVVFGSTTIYDDTTPAWASNASRAAFLINILMGNQNAANVQALGGLIAFSTNVGGTASGLGDMANAANVNIPIFGSAAEDTTGLLTFKVTVTHSLAHANTSIRRQYACLELI